MKIKIIITVVMLLLAICSCGNRSDNDSLSEQGIPVSLNIRTRTSDIEFTIKTLRVMVFSNGGDVIHNQLFDELSITDPIRIETTTGQRRLLIIANEPVVLKSQLVGAATHTQVDKMILESIYQENDILPFIYQSKVEIKPTGNQQIHAQLSRVVSKIDVVMTKEQGLNKTAELMSAQLVNLPRKSLLLAQSTDWMTNNPMLTDAQKYYDYPSDAPLTMWDDPVLTEGTRLVVLNNRYAFERNAGDSYGLGGGFPSVNVVVRLDGVDKYYTVPLYYQNNFGQLTYGIARNYHFIVVLTICRQGIRIAVSQQSQWEDNPDYDRVLGQDDENIIVKDWEDHDNEINEDI